MMEEEMITCIRYFTLLTKSRNGFKMAHLWFPHVGTWETLTPRGDALLFRGGEAYLVPTYLWALYHGTYLQKV